MINWFKKIFAQNTIKTLSETWFYDLFVKPTLPSKDKGIGFDNPIDYNPDTHFTKSEEPKLKALNWATFQSNFLTDPEANKLYNNFKELFSNLYTSEEVQNHLFGSEDESYNNVYSLLGRTVLNDSNSVKEIENSSSPQDTFNNIKKGVKKTFLSGNPRSGGRINNMSNFELEAVSFIRNLILNNQDTNTQLHGIRNRWKELQSGRTSAGRPAKHGINQQDVYNLFIKDIISTYDESNPMDMRLDWSWSQFKEQLRKYVNAKGEFDNLSKKIGEFIKEYNLNINYIRENVDAIADYFVSDINELIEELHLNVRSYTSEKKERFRQRGTMNDPETGEPYKPDSMNEYAVIDILSIYGYQFTTEQNVYRREPDGSAKKTEDGKLAPPRRVDYVFSNGTYLEVFGVEYDQPSSKKKTQLPYEEVKKEKMSEWKDRLYYIDTTGQDALFRGDIGSQDVNLKRPLTKYCDLLDMAAAFDPEKGQYDHVGLQGNTNHRAQFLSRFELIVGQQNEIAVNFYRLWANDSMGPDQLIDYVGKFNWMRSQGPVKDISQVKEEYYNLYGDDADTVIPPDQLSPLIPRDVVQRSFEKKKEEEQPNNAADAFIHMMKEANMQNIVDVSNIPGLPKMDQIRSELASGVNGLPPLYSVAHNIASEFEMVAMYFQTFSNIMTYIQQIIDKLDEYMNYQNQPLGFVGPDQTQQQQFQQPFGIAAENWTWEIKTAQRLGDDELTKKIRQHIKDSSFFHRLFEMYGISIDRIDTELECQKADLGTRNAKNKGNILYFNYNLFDEGDFFENGIHYVVHEMIHWLTNQREKKCYFTDPEEMQAFTLGIAYEIFRGVPKKYIVEIYFPIIEKHFKCNNDAKELFAKFYKSALKLQERFK